jgi:PAS domain-containing protein
VAAAQKPLELILARNLLTSLSTPAFLLDENSALVFYNESAGALLGISFEETGRMDPQEWTGSFGPFNEDDEPVSLDDLDITHSLRERRPAHSKFCIRSAKGVKHSIEAAAFPIIASEEGASGAMIFFWQLEGNGAGGS